MEMVVVRLLTYALMVKYGFNVKADGRILNPAAVFCNNREHYQMLSHADAGTPENLERWCIYVLEGILVELKKLDQLMDYDYLRTKILSPALNYLLERKTITALESAILQKALQVGIVKSNDLSSVMAELTTAQRTYQIRKLVGLNLLRPISENAWQYTIGFSNSCLLRGVTRMLTVEGFISTALTG